MPEARQLLTDSVKKMTVQDAKGILTGGETSGTGLYFMVAEEKKKIRKDPAAAGTAILRKVFGTLQK